MSKIFKKPAKYARVNLFFVEMIIAVLFFSVSAVYTLNVFASASNASLKNKLNERINLTAQALSEWFSETGDINASFEEVFGIRPAKMPSGEYCLTLDENCRYSAEEAGFLTLEVLIEEDSTPAGTLSHMTAKFIRGGDAVFEMTSSAYKEKTDQE